MESNVILQGHALDVLKTLPSESVDCVVTSPPYWSLRDYGEATNCIWGGQADCAHHFVSTTRKRRLQPLPPVSPGATRRKHEVLDGEGRGNNSFTYTTATCTRCGAWRGQLGLEPTFDLYLDHLCAIFDEVHRVLKQAGTCWVNMGDVYHNSTKWTNATALPQTISHGNNRGYAGMQRPPQRLPEKCLALIPFRFAIAMVSRGWILRNSIIWHKPNAMPQSARDRFTIDHEHLFFFAKSRRYYFEPQLEPASTKTHCPPRQSRGRKTALNRSSEGVSGGGWADATTPYRPLMRNKRCVWSIPLRPVRDAHFAVYPEALCETPIRAGCPRFVCRRCGAAKTPTISRGTRVRTGGTRQKPTPGIGERDAPTGFRPIVRVGFRAACSCRAGYEPGILLDPFFGTGTTGVVALKLGRRFLGVELNPAYVGMAGRRVDEWRSDPHSPLSL